MRIKALLLLSSFAALSATAASADDRQWLPQAGNPNGPRFYVTSVIDPNSEMVLVSGRVDQASAKEWCDANGKGEGCVEQVLAEYKTKEARSTADCAGGSMYATDVKQYVIDAGADARAPRWTDASGKAVDPASDWGKALDHQWKIMCPEAKPVKQQVAAAPKAAPVKEPEPAREQSYVPEPEPVRPGAPIPAPLVAAPRTQEARVAEPVRASGGFVDPSDLSGSLWDHNGSAMRIDEERGVIVYEEPKASISKVARRGTVLFRGQLGYPRPGQVIRGTAYAFKSGCAPAAYPVTGRYSADNSEIILQGAGPTWNGCSYSLTNRSKHATLRFRSMMSP